MPRTKFVAGNPRKRVIELFNELVRIKVVLADSTIRELAEELNISQASMYHKVQGKNEWKFDEILKVMSVLHFTKDEILAVFEGVIVV